MSTTENVSRETSGELGDENDEGRDDGQPTETTETDEETTESEEPARTAEDETDSSDNENGSSELSRVRREAAGYRTQLREAEAERDTLRSELFTARVAATGRLADPSDMPVNPDLLADPDALESAISELLESKPHLKARRFGSIGQEDKRHTEGVSLGSILRKNA